MKREAAEFIGLWKYLERNYFVQATLANESTLIIIDRLKSPLSPLLKCYRITSDGFESTLLREFIAIDAYKD